MKILWLSHNVPYPPIGGVLQRNYNLLKEVATQHDVYLIALNQRALLPTSTDVSEARIALEKLCSYVEVLPIPSEQSVIDWFKLLFRSLFTKHPYTINWLKSKQMHRRIHNIVMSKHFDVVHYDTISLAEYLKQTCHIPAVLNHHNIESAMMLRRALNSTNIVKRLYFLLEGRKLREYEKQMGRRFHSNLTVSELDRARLSTIIPGKRIHVVPNGVDIGYFSGRSERIIKNSLVFSGRLNSYANQDAVRFLIREICPLLKAEVGQVHLMVVGRNPTREMLKMADADSNIEILGDVVDVRPYLAKGEIYVCPVRDGGGTRLKLLDAFAMGKAVVSTSIGCEGLDVRPNDNILIADSPSEFVKQITRVFRDPALRVVLGQEARKLVEDQYCWTKVGKTLNNVYMQVTCDAMRGRES